MLASNCPGHRGFQRNLQLFTRVFHGVIELHVVRIDVIDVSQLSSIVELRHVYSPMPFFFLLRGFFLTTLTRPLAMGNRAWMLLELLSVAPPSGPHVPIWKVFVRYCELSETGPWPR